MDYIQLAAEIHRAGNEIAVPAIHALFSDAVSNDGELPYSKTAGALIQEIMDSGAATITDEPINKISIDLDAMAIFGNIKYAAKYSSDLKRLARECDGYLQKLADEMAAPEVEPDAPEVEAPAMPKYDKAEEMDIWKKYKATGDKTHLSNLLDRYAPVFHMQANRFKGYQSVPPSVIRAEAKKWAIKAFDTYDPTRGTQLNTHVFTYMQKVGRFVREQAGVVKMPEEWHERVRGFQDKEGEFASKNGRTPTTHEMADEMAWSAGNVAKMRKFLGKNLISEMNEESLARMETPPDEKANLFIDYLHHEFSGDDKLVFEHLNGLGGQQRIDTADGIAKATGLKLSRVNQARKRIQTTAQHYQRYM